MSGASSNRGVVWLLSALLAAAWVSHVAVADDGAPGLGEFSEALGFTMPTGTRVLAKSGSSRGDGVDIVLWLAQGPELPAITPSLDAEGWRGFAPTDPVKTEEYMFKVARRNDVELVWFGPVKAIYVYFSHSRSSSRYLIIASDDRTTLLLLQVLSSVSPEPPEGDGSKAGGEDQ